MARSVKLKDPKERERRSRVRAGADHHDEVWNGEYFMPPLPNNEHQGLVTQLVTILQIVIGWSGLGQVFPGVNVTDRDKGWKKNFRAPDVVVFLKSTRALSRLTNWLGGPDFLIEIMSPGDRSRRKLAFYGKVGVREVLLVDRHPWKLELYRLQGNKLILVGQSTVAKAGSLTSEVVPLSFRLLAGDDRPLIEVVHNDGVQTWRV